MTTKSRTKRAVRQLLTPEAAQQEMKDYADATSELKALEAEIEKMKNGIVEAYKGRITRFQARRDDAINTLQNYALLNRVKLFKNKKSFTFDSGTIGFRETTPKVVKATKKTWPELLSIIKAFAPDLIRSKEYINKERMIERRADSDLMTKLSTLGVSVEQNDTFFCVSNEEDLR